MVVCKEKRTIMHKFLVFAALLGLAACSNNSHKITDLNDEKVFFDFDSAVVKPEMNEHLLAQSRYMKEHRDINITMAGHCDERGSTEYNLALGALRAGNAAHVLIRDGIEPARIKTVSYGKNRPQYFGTGESVWSKNRNATTTVNNK